MADPIRLGSPAPSRDTSSSSPFRRQQRGVRAAQEVLADRFRAERDALEQLLARLQALKGDLQARLLSGVTAFRASQVRTLLGDVDALMADTLSAIARDTRRTFDHMATLGEQSADRAMRAAQITLMPTPGLDADLVTAAYDNTLDLLTPAMQQYRTEIATSLRRVALAGDGRMEEIQRLQRILEGQGFDNARYRAERIVRTELGRTFNQAAHERFVQLSAQAPFLRKVWRATNDSRTRRGHREAGRTYARGQGVQVADRFVLTHYDHKDQPTGTVRLRFPLDPEAEPAGRLAAANTIMCRCSAIIDFDQRQMADVTRQQVSVAVSQGTPKRPVGASPATAAPAPSVPAAAPPAMGPAGPRVSTALVVRGASLQSEARRAMAAIDDVHGDGALPPLPLEYSRARDIRGQVEYYGDRGAQRMQITTPGLQDHPQMTLWHESGHWLDLMAIGKGGIAHPGTLEASPYGGQRLTRAPAAPLGATRIGQMTSADFGNLTMQAWRTAVEGTEAYRRLQLWAEAAPNAAVYRAAPSRYRGYRGDGTIPTDVDPRHVAYLLQPAELWARTYAQYIATRSGQAAGRAQLQAMQRASTTTAVAATGRHLRDWDYPSQWSDADFDGIARAIDALFEGLGWRKAR